MRLLLVEDDPLLGDGIRAGLVQAGFTVDWIKDGEHARSALETEHYALVVLDLGLPRLGGGDLLRQLRTRGDDTPVLILTARDTVSDRVSGLDAGADDYLVKPFDLDELTARIRALLRRAGGRATPLLHHGTLEVDLAPLVVEEIFAILAELLENRGRVLSRERLENSLYGWSGEVESNAVEVHIHHLRKKLGSELIRTIRGVGYMVEKQP